MTLNQAISQLRELGTIAKARAEYHRISNPVVFAHMTGRSEAFLRAADILTAFAMADLPNEMRREVIAATTSEGKRS